MSRDTAPTAEIGIIGGSGFYELPGLEAIERFDLRTPFGLPSSTITVGHLDGRGVAFIARHGDGHRILPSELPSRANIYVLKELGVHSVLAVSAVGSLREALAPRHAVVPDQLIDRTSGRESTFFGDGAVAHVGFADPFCPDLAARLATAAEANDVTTHRGGTLVVINGPAFSTRAESNLYRQWGADIIGMTAIPEAKLAREAELHYGALCFVTDYDVWHETEEDVSAEVVLRNLAVNTEHGRLAVAEVIGGMPQGGPQGACGCSDALAGALITPWDRVPSGTRERLELLVRRHLVVGGVRRTEDDAS